MALTKCHECGKEVSDKANVCPHCGAPAKPTVLQKGRRITRGVGKVIYIAVAILIAIIVFQCSLNLGTAIDSKFDPNRSGTPR